MKAAPVQQGWQSAVGGRRDGEWCRCNSNSSDCPGEESPGSHGHQEERGRTADTARGKRTVRSGGGIQRESKGHLRSVTQEEEWEPRPF